MISDTSQVVQRSNIDVAMSWFLMNNKKKEEKRSSEIKKQYLRAVNKDTDGKLSKDEWLNVLVQANIQNSE